MGEAESQIEKKLSKIRAETEQKIAEINNKMLLAEKEANKEIALVENQIVVIKEASKAKSAKCTLLRSIDRQQKMIELNKKRLIPEKELANVLTNLKATNKTVYQSSLREYLATAKHLLGHK